MKEMNLLKTMLVFNPKKERYDLAAKKKLRFLNPNSKKRAFYHRGTDADNGVVKQIFEKREYDLSGFKRNDDILNKYTNIVSKNKIPLIIDCGANIGASVLFFSTYFPEAHIVAIEPDSNNFFLLQKNTEGLNTKLINAAVSNETGKGILIDPDEGEWGYRLGENTQHGNLVDIIGMSDILKSIDLDKYIPFIAKIDIEGGEADLFAKHTDWFDLFYVSIIELHDWLLPKGRTSKSFLKVISELDRDFIYRDENIFSIKND